MQISKKLEAVIRTRPVVINVGLTLFLIAVAFMVTYQPPADEKQRSYDVDIAAGVMLPGGTINGVPTTTPTISILVKGGKDVANLQTLTISINNQTVGEMNPPGKANYRWTYVEQDFPVQDANGNHVVATGHFSDGKNIVLLDTTV